MTPDPDGQKRETIEESDKSYLGSIPAVSGFLGGITVAVMVVIMQDKNKFVYLPFSNLTKVDFSVLLITDLAAISTVFVFATLLSLGTAHVKGTKSKDFFLRYTQTKLFFAMGSFTSALIFIGFIGSSLWIDREPHGASCGHPKCQKCAHSDCQRP